MKKYFFLLAVLCPLLSYCQNSDSTSMNKKLATTAPFFGGVTVSNIVTPISNNGNAITIQQPIVDIGFPVYKNFSTPHPILIKTGIRYQGLYLSGKENISSNGFQSVTVPFLINYSVSRITTITFVGLATVGSDFKRSIGTEDILYTVGARAGFRLGRSFKCGVTLTYTNNYSGSFLLPIPDIDWKISNKFTLTGIIPARASLKYALSSIQSLGITGSFNSVMYRLNGATDQYIHLRQNNAGFIYDLKLSRHWKINVIAGHTFSQRLETFNMDQKVPFEHFGKLNDRLASISYRNNSFLFQGGISYEF